MTDPKIKTVKPDGDDGPRYYVFEGEDKPIPGVTSVLSSYSPGGGEGLLTWSANLAAEYAIRWATVGGEDGELLGQAATRDPDACYKRIASARKRSRDESAQRGNDAHDTIERVAFSTLDELRKLASAAPVASDDPFADEPLCRWALIAWGRFVAKYNVRVLYSEVSIYSRNGHMGTTDLIVEMDTPWLDTPRGVVIVDTKTGDIREKVSLQLSSYRFGDYIISDNDGKIEYTELPKIDAAAAFRPRDDGLFDFLPVRADEDDYKVFLAALTLFEWEKGRGRTAIGKALDGRKTKPKKPPIDWGI